MVGVVVVVVGVTGVVGGSVVIDQLHQSGSKLNFHGYYMDRGF